MLTTWGIFYVLVVSADFRIWQEITTTELSRRLRAHRRSAKVGDARAVCAAWRKYGEPEATVIAQYQTREELIAAEVATIRDMGTLVPTGYNMSDGFYNAPTKNPEVAAKISAANKGRPKPPRSEEHRRNMSLAKTGVKRAPRTQAHKDAIGASRKGIQFSEEWRANIGKAHIGRKQSEETKEKRKGSWANRTLEQNMEMARKRMATRAAKQQKQLETDV